jgi:hypothetical protein
MRAKNIPVLLNMLIPLLDQLIFFLVLMGFDLVVLAFFGSRNFIDYSQGNFIGFAKKNLALVVLIQLFKISEDLNRPWKRGMAAGFLCLFLFTMEIHSDHSPIPQAFADPFWGHAGSGLITLFPLGTLVLYFANLSQSPLLLLGVAWAGFPYYFFTCGWLYEKIIRFSSTKSRLNP